MKGTKVSLGLGIITTLDSIALKNNGMPEENLWETIYDFGIVKDDLKKLNLTYNEISEIYSAIKNYRESLRYLKELKNKMCFNQKD